jgi:hypothetical protein
VQSGLISKLEERPWRTDILKVDGRQVYISGGSRQGLKVGDKLAVLQAGETVKSGQSGFNIALPATVVGQVQITSLFGDNETNEGSVTQLIGGNVTADRANTLYVSELKE